MYLFFLIQNHQLPIFYIVEQELKANFYYVLLGRRGVVKGRQKWLKQPFKYHRNAMFSLLISNEKINFETFSELRILCLKSREFYSAT